MFLSSLKSITYIYEEYLQKNPPRSETWRVWSLLLWYWPWLTIQATGISPSCSQGPDSSFVLDLSEGEMTAPLHSGSLWKQSWPWELYLHQSQVHTQPEIEEGDIDKAGLWMRKRDVDHELEMNCWGVHSQKVRRSLLNCCHIQKLFPSRVGANWKYTAYQKRTHIFGEEKKKKKPTTGVKHKTSKSRSQPLCARWPDHMQLQLTSSGLSGLTVKKCSGTWAWELLPHSWQVEGRKGELRWEEVSKATDWKGIWLTPVFVWEAHLKLLHSLYAWVVNLSLSFFFGKCGQGGCGEW